MAFTEDLTEFFDTDDFAVEATITKTDGSDVCLLVHFNMPQEVVDLNTGNITLDDFFFMCKTADLDGVARGNSVEVNAVTYSIQRMQALDDGNISEVYLRT